MDALITYKNDPALKAAFLGQLAEHEAADAFLQGTYAQMNGHFRGCGIGCSLHSLNVIQGRTPLFNTDVHARFPSELGWPLWLAYLEDHVFEHLPIEAAKHWPRQLSEAVPVGVTVPDVVLAKLLRWVLIGEERRPHDGRTLRAHHRRGNSSGRRVERGCAGCAGCAGCGNTRRLLSSPIRRSAAAPA